MWFFRSPCRPRRLIVICQCIQYRPRNGVRSSRNISGYFIANYAASRTARRIATAARAVFGADFVLRPNERRRLRRKLLDRRRTEHTYEPQSVVTIFGHKKKKKKNNAKFHYTLCDRKPYIFEAEVPLMFSGDLRLSYTKCCARVSFPPPTIHNISVNNKSNFTLIKIDNLCVTKSIWKLWMYLMDPFNLRILHHSLFGCFQISYIDKI